MATADAWGNGQKGVKSRESSVYITAASHRFPPRLGMQLSVRPLESVLKGGEGWLVLAPVTWWCQTWLLEAPSQRQVPEPGWCCGTGTRESRIQLLSDSHGAFPTCFCRAGHGAHRYQAMEMWVCPREHLGLLHRIFCGRSRQNQGRKGNHPKDV